MSLGRRRRVASLLVASIVAGAVVSAQSPATPAAPGVQPASSEPPFVRLPVVAGRSHVLPTAFDVKRLAVTNPAVADAAIVTLREILIDAKAPGITSLILWGDTARIQYDIVVETGAPPLQQQIQAIFPSEDIRVNVTDEAVVLSGHASSNDVARKAVEIAQASSAKLKVINLLDRPGGPDSQQVMLEVRFAEVNHNAMTELGMTFLASRADFSARTTTSQFPAPFEDSAVNGIRVPDYLNVFVALNRDGLLATIKALQQRGQFQSLAEPNLIAYNGQEASFLAGGEFPIPVVSGTSGIASVSVIFKEFGIRLRFTPRIFGDLIRLRVNPEVSTLDFNNGINLSGLRIPGLTTRRAETEVELKDGQTFAIAGLLNNTSLETNSAIPWLSNVPIIGHLFKSKSDSAARTELLVMITPHLVRPLEPAEVPPLPIDYSRFVRPRSGVGGLLQGGGGFLDAPAPAADEKGSTP